MRFRIITATLAVAAVTASFAPARAAGVRILVSNYRFCIERPIPCDPLDVGYAPDADGQPLAEQYSPITTATVKPGDTVTFVYADQACDTAAFLLGDQGCKGHDVRIVGGALLQRLHALKTETLTFTVPQTATPGTVIPYFCPVDDHYRGGMTGALRVSA